MNNRTYNQSGIFQTSLSLSFICLLLATCPSCKWKDSPANQPSVRQRAIRNLVNVKLGEMKQAIESAYSDGVDPFQHYGDQTKLSWRVKLLPYLGERDLYKKFALEEAWDSKHNSPLIDAMPTVYEDTEDTHSHKLSRRTTRFVAMRQEELEAIPFDLPHVRVRDLVVLEVGREDSVLWTAPDQTKGDQTKGAGRE